MTNVAKPFLVAGALLCAAHLEAQVTEVTNANYGFSLQVPAGWSLQRVKMPDPLPDVNEFKAGRVTLRGSIDTGSKEPPDWNALQFNGMQAIGPDGKVPLPQITMYAHPHEARTFEQFSTEFAEWLEMFQMKQVSANQSKTKSGLDVYEFIYQVGRMPVRVAMVYGNGVRYGFMSMARDTASFREQAPAFQTLVTSLELKKPRAPAAVD